ncbi:hypothetical protein HYPSUDRAFT_171469 [Hypholoma sublateritium FD-334 SS-4]|uniref:Uncharacterized protein n=1 Tax=Hypholoma sublateritium (strain FD-334 SS-4) TaxID=945553 RepID=A0A0D2KP17_HYPSF|nr:hypothetical protein HYPSUDRAFT_171469 [Hypholoma sublateritium FD-334 SS-4]
MDPLAVFFSRYPGLEYNPSESAPLEFDRLCTTEKMVLGEWKRHKAYMAFHHALTQQFNANYGTDADSLRSWKLLCLHIGISPLPRTLEERRKAVMQAHINLVDLVDAFGTGRLVKAFRTGKALREYSWRTGKYFPRDDKDAGDLLKYLQRRDLLDVPDIIAGDRPVPVGRTERRAEEGLKKRRTDNGEN